MEVSQLTPHAESAGPLEPSWNATLGQVSRSAVQEPSGNALLPLRKVRNRPDVGEFTP
jgi:hypothetical protein